MNFLIWEVTFLQETPDSQDAGGMNINDTIIFCIYT